MPTPIQRETGTRGARIATGLALAPLAALAGWIAYSRFGIDRGAPLHPALPGRREDLVSAAGGLSFYGSADRSRVPLLLIHSVNAAASAYEVRPLYCYYARSRPVYALDLPGYGFSERSDRLYTPRLMQDALHAVTAEIRKRHGGVPVDALALSLSCEFLAAAAGERPGDYRSLALISPSGFDARFEGRPQDRSRHGGATARAILSVPLWGRPLYDLLVSRPSLRFFLGKTWGSPDIDEGLLAYDVMTAHRPGAEYAPFSFLSGALFSDAPGVLYSRLAHPVWLLHGQRGDFVDYRHAEDFKARPNWVVDTLPTGAFPHFEVLPEVTDRYDTFLSVLPA